MLGGTQTLCFLQVHQTHRDESMTTKNNKTPADTEESGNQIAPKKVHGSTDEKT